MALSTKESGEYRNITKYQEENKRGWIKKKSDIFQGADATCEKCCASEGDDVHHGFYFGCTTNKHRYPDATLWCLCRNCHKEVTPPQVRLLCFIGSINPSEYGHALDVLHSSGHNWKQDPDFNADDAADCILSNLPERPQWWAEYLVCFHVTPGVARTESVGRALTSEFNGISVEFAEGDDQAVPMILESVFGPDDDLCGVIENRATELAARA